MCQHGDDFQSSSSAHWTPSSLYASLGWRWERAGESICSNKSKTKKNSTYTPSNYWVSPIFKLLNKPLTILVHCGKYSPESAPEPPWTVHRLCIALLHLTLYTLSLFPQVPAVEVSVPAEFTKSFLRGEDIDKRKWSIILWSPFVLKLSTHFSQSDCELSEGRVHFLFISGSWIAKSNSEP